MGMHRYQKHHRDIYQRRKSIIINHYVLKQNQKIGVCGKLLKILQNPTYKHNNSSISNGNNGSKIRKRFIIYEINNSS